MRIIQLVTLMLILALATFALAQVPSFEELDTDADGYISRSEASALPCLAANYDNIDARSDKGLDRSEYQAAVAEYCQIES
ncbi:MAG: hypothetical protein ACNA7E_07470 [Wenzhouxiangellaceae bacterium]